MKEMNCNIVNDLLPLYVDGVLCEDSRKLVEEHVNGCEKCREGLKKMETDIPKMEDKDIKPFKKIRRKLLVRAVLIVILLCVIAAGVFTAQMTWVPVHYAGEELMNQMEVVFMEDGLYIRREELSARGDIILVDSSDGVIKFYIGESIWDRHRIAWTDNTCYTRILNCEIAGENRTEEMVKEVDYCDKDGKVLYTLWRKE